jgi:uncharacterized protein YecE (DUF72 family)
MWHGAVTPPLATTMIRIGCSGWQYKHWKGDFYPSTLRPREWFEQYARTFDTVEINNSFYRLPEAHTFRSWRERAPSGFLYAVKASRYLTHMKKLKDPEGPLQRFFENAAPLGATLGPVLYQLPPRWPLDLERFRHFLTALPRGVRHAVEFREPSWYAPEVFMLLAAHGVALCLHDMMGSATGRLRVGPFVYVRFHGVTRYGGRYGDEELRPWADWLGEEHASERDVYAYFNNDIGGHAPRDALRLREMVTR